MNILQTIKELFVKSNEYKSNSEAVIIACYFNPQKNPYRLIAFNKFYKTIKHLNHRIIECVIGDAIPELPNNSSISKIYTKDLLWHKETLLNKIVSELPNNFKYVFWLDTDVIFSNKNWLVESVEQLETNNIVQPFEYCVHLDKDYDEPDFDITHEYEYVNNPKTRHRKMWRSFCANYVTTDYSDDNNYDKHGHVGFAWGARRKILDSVPLYDRALIGGADHLIAHAAAGHILHTCIKKSFTENLLEIENWSNKFYDVVKGKIGYVKGDLFHIWHGDISKRQYLKRIQDFTTISKKITKKDINGMYISENDETEYVKEYFNHREDISNNHRDVIIKPNLFKHIDDKTLQLKKTELKKQYPTNDDSFIDMMLMSYFSSDNFVGNEILGNILNNDIQPIDQGFEEGFGGGGFSGGGSGGEWDAPTNNNENFS